MCDSPKPLRWTLKSRPRERAKTASVPESDPADPPDDEALMAALAETRPDSGDVPAEPIWKGCCIHAVNGVELVTDPAGVVYWPGEDTILVADLHLEKGSSFAQRGQMLPPYDTAKTLQRLSAVIEKWRPARVIALGDSFHDREAHLRLLPDALDILEELMDGRDWLWISGNHDPDPPEVLGGDIANEFETRGLLMRHEPLSGAKAGEIAGHLHPKARLVRRGRHVRRSCFAASRNRMILPSFGAYTGGLDVFHEAFEGLFEGRDFHVLMRGNEQVFRIPAKELR